MLRNRATGLKLGLSLPSSSEDALLTPHLLAILSNNRGRALLGFGGTRRVNELAKEEERGGSSGLVGGSLQLGASRSRGHERQRLDGWRETRASRVARQQRKIVVASVGGTGRGLAQNSLRDGMEHLVSMILVMLTTVSRTELPRTFMKIISEIHSWKRVEAIMPGSLHASRSIFQKSSSAPPGRR